MSTLAKNAHEKVQSQPTIAVHTHCAAQNDALAACRRASIQQLGLLSTLLLQMQGIQKLQLHDRGAFLYFLTSLQSDLEIPARTMMSHSIKCERKAFLFSSLVRKSRTLNVDDIGV